MNQKQEFALALIRAPWAKRLTDRSFILAVAAGVIGLYLFSQKSIDGDAFCTLIGYTWGPWILGNQATTAAVGSAALKDTPDTVNAGTVNNVAAPALPDTAAASEEIPIVEDAPENPNVEVIED